MRAQGTYLGHVFSPQSEYIWEAASHCFSHGCFSLSLSLLLFSSLLFLLFLLLLLLFLLVFLLCLLLLLSLKSINIFLKSKVKYLSQRLVTVSLQTSIKVLITCVVITTKKHCIRLLRGDIQYVISILNSRSYFFICVISAKVTDLSRSRPFASFPDKATGCCGYPGNY